MSRTKYEVSSYTDLTNLGKNVGESNWDWGCPSPFVNAEISILTQLRHTSRQGATSMYNTRAPNSY